jgi:hypothetical protein
MTALQWVYELPSVPSSPMRQQGKGTKPRPPCAHIVQQVYQVDPWVSIKIWRCYSALLRAQDCKRRALPSAVPHSKLQLTLLSAGASNACGAARYLSAGTGHQAYTRDEYEEEYPKRLPASREFLESCFVSTCSAGAVSQLV